MSIITNELSLWMKQVDERLEKLESLIESKNIQEIIKDENDVSIGEFVRAKKPKTSFEKGLVIAYFKEKKQGISPFTVEELKQGHIEARESLPANLSDITYQAVKRGLMMKTSSKKQDGFWPMIMTNLGVEFVENLSINI